MAGAAAPTPGITIASMPLSADGSAATTASAPTAVRALVMLTMFAAP